MARQRAMTWEVFDRKYGPVIDAPDGGQLFQTYEHKLTLEFPLERVWSVVDGDNGELYVIPGYHVVNMQGYCITTKPWGEPELADLTVKW